MDATCSVCGHVTDDSTGKCRFCGTPFEVKKSKKADHEPEPVAVAIEPEPVGKSKGK